MLKRLTVTFTEAERVALDRLAQADVRPVKDQVRALVRDAAKARCIWFDDPATVNYRGRPDCEYPAGVEL